jgi:hypothetical protein
MSKLITIDQIRGKLRLRVENAIKKASEQGFIVFQIRAAVDIDHEYSWRSRGKYIAIRLIKPEDIDNKHCNYHTEDIYYK